MRLHGRGERRVTSAADRPDSARLPASAGHGHGHGHGGGGRPISGRRSQRTLTRAAASAAVALVGLTAAATPPAARAADGTWTGTAAGNWGDAARWKDGVVADGPGAVANFPTTTGTVTLDGSRTIGDLVVGPTTSFTLAAVDGAVLTLDHGQAAGAPAFRFGDTTTTRAFILPVLAGSDGLSMSGGNFVGPLNVTLNPANVYTGTTTLFNTRVRVAAGAPLGAPTPLGTSTSAVRLASSGAVFLTGPGTFARDVTVFGASPFGATIGVDTADAATFSGVMTADSTTLNLWAAAGGTLQLTGPGITGTGGLTKEGRGDAISARTNTYTGATHVTGGRLTLTGPAGAAPATSGVYLQAYPNTTPAVPIGVGRPTLVLDNSAGFNPARLPVIPVVLGGGELAVVGSPAVGENVTQTFSALSFSAGASVIRVDNRNPANATEVVFRSSRQPFGGIVHFAASGGVLGGSATTGPRVVLTKAVNTNGILGGGATVDGDFAAVGADGAVRPYAGYAPLAAGGLSATANYAADADVTLTAGGGGTINALKLAATPTGQTVALGDQTLTVASGGVLKTGPGETRITAAAGKLAVAGEFYAHVQEGTLRLDKLPTTGGQGGIVQTGAGTLAVEDVTAASGRVTLGIVTSGMVSLRLPTGSRTLSEVTGPGGLTLRGGGTFDLSNNVFTGPLVVDGGHVATTQGILQDPADWVFSPFGATGGQTVTLTNSGTVTLSGLPQTSVTFRIGAGGGTVEVTGTGSLVLDPGRFAGTPAGGELTKAGTGTLALTGPAPGYDGANSYVTGGTLRLHDADALGDAPDAAGTKSRIHLSAGTTLELVTAADTAYNNPVRLAGDTATLRLTAAAATTGTIRYDLGNLTVGTTGTLTLARGSTVTGSSGVAVARFPDVTLNGNLTVAGTGNLVFGPIRQDGANRSLTKTAAGELELTGQGTYAGGTTLSAGGLVLSVGSAGPAGAPTAGPLGTGPLVVPKAATVGIRAGGGDVTLGNPIQLGGLGDGAALTLGRADDPATAGKLTFTGPVTLDGVRTVRPMGADPTRVVAEFAGPIGGSGDLLFSGNAATILSGSSTYSGVDTVVRSGRLYVNNLTGSGTGTGTGNVSVVGSQGPAVLGGTGSIAGGVSVGAGGTLDAGMAATGDAPTVGGTLAMARLSMAASEGTVRFDLNGPTPGDGPGLYDQLLVTGPAVVGGDLRGSVAQGFVPAATDVFYVLARGPGSSGTFVGQPEGSLVDLGDGAHGMITYLSNWTGDPATSTLAGGNDVAIYKVTVPEPAAVGLLAGAITAGLLTRRPLARRTRPHVS